MNARHSFPRVESIKVIQLSEGRTIRITRDRTKENLKADYGDGDIHLTCVAQAHDPAAMIKTLARLENVTSVQLIDAKGNGLTTYNKA